jgi:nucleoside-diphosphate-sugar epimerase
VSVPRLRLALVTGGSGTIGRRLVVALRDSGWSVRALVHRREVPEADESTAGSLLDAPALTDAARDCTAVVHLAGVTHARRADVYRRLNVEGTRNVVAAAEAAGARRLLFVSSRAATGTGGAYGVSKLRAEAAVRSARVPWTIVRLAEVYGAEGAEGVDRVIALARDGRRIPLMAGGQDEVCPVHVDDAVEACVRALGASAAVSRTYTLAGDCMTLRAFAEDCRAAFGSRSAITPVPRWLVRAASEAARILPLPLYPDQLARLAAPKPTASPEASTDLGFVPRPLATGLHHHRPDRPPDGDVRAAGRESPPARN